MACGTDAGTWVAMMAEVKVDKTTGKVKVVRVACAQDMGLCVNPQGALIQMEGCIQMGLGYSLTEEITFEGGDIKNRGFDNYEIPRFSWTPKMDCVILDRQNIPPKGEENLPSLLSEPQSPMRYLMLQVPGCTGCQ